MIRLVITDMDGTLLHNDKSMPDQAFAMIEQLHQKGIAFAAASGRQYASLKANFGPYASQMHFICENGAVTADGATDQIIDTHYLPFDQVVQFVRICRRIPDTYVVVCAPHEAYYEIENDIVKNNISDYYHSHKLVDDLTALQCDVVKIAILNLNGTADHVYPFFEQFKDRYSMAVSAFEWMDIMMPGIHKGVGVKQLQKRLGITKEETMACGDFMNDYELLQEASYSFAMKNAIAEIKKIAHYETAYTNEEDGVIREVAGRLHLDL